jgi:UDP-N-acetylmuramoylalanine--D-glutamate ligase
MQRYMGQSVLVLGMGASGMAMARWCARLGAHVCIADTREQETQWSQLQQEHPGAERLSGPWSADMLEVPGTGQPVDLVLCSPGLSPAELQPITAAAQERGIAVGGELSVFAQALAELAHDKEGQKPYRPHVLAITGTNGKTTVTQLTHFLLERAGLHSVIAGNVGPTLLDTLHEALAQDRLPEVWVLELSSFQLMHNAGFEPSAATVLNVTQDHLDWHGDMAHYVGAKSRVFGSTGLMVLNRDDAQVLAMAPPAPASPLSKKRVTTAPARPVLTFGAGLPQAPGDYGLETAAGMVWLVRAWPEEDGTRGSSNGAASPLHLQRLMPADALRIRGRHNALNALAALALAASTGVKLAPMLYALREYRGEPHRLQSVAIVQGVEYIDDSKGTNVGATVAALSGLGAAKNICLILGGDGKGQDFSPLCGPVATAVKQVLLIGRDAERIAAQLQDTGVPMSRCADMLAAVEQASQHARSGDVVLLSPACASLDMYSNYAHRAQVFREAVHALATDSGQVLAGEGL